MIGWLLDLRYAPRTQLLGLVTLVLVLVGLPITAIADSGLPGRAALGMRRSAEGLLGLTTTIAPNVTVAPRLALGDGHRVTHPVELANALATASPPAPVVSPPPVSAPPVTRAVSLPAAPPSTPPLEEPPVEAPATEAPPLEPEPTPPREEPKSEPPPKEEPKQEPPPKEEPKSEPPAVPALYEAGFEEGSLDGWSTAGVGEVVPRVTTGIVRDGSYASTVVLTGTTDRSELILGGNGSGSTRGTIEFSEGDEYWYGFSFYISAMVYGHPGAHNLIMQFKSDGTGSPLFGLQLWDVNGRKGLWTGGPSQEINHSGERFLAAVPEDVWHDVQIHFRASEVGAGFYELFLDGNLIDAQSNVTMIVPGRRIAYIKTGLYRNGDEIPGTSELKIDSAKLGTTRESVLP
ncbi:MAG: heparin lyase I family protein [Solirubrobacterales bacterium]